MPLRRNPYPDWVLEQRDRLRHRIAARRIEKGYSQDQLAELVGVDRRTIQRIERGERDVRYLDLLLIAHALDTTAAELGS